MKGFYAPLAQRGSFYLAPVGSLLPLWYWNLSLSCLEYGSYLVLLYLITFLRGLLACCRRVVIYYRIEKKKQILGCRRTCMLGTSYRSPHTATTPLRAAGFGSHFNYLVPTLRTGQTSCLFGGVYTRLGPYRVPRVLIFCC